MWLAVYKEAAVVKEWARQTLFKSNGVMPPSSDTLWYSSSHTLALVRIMEAGHREDFLDDPRVLDTRALGRS